MAGKKPLPHRLTPDPRFGKCPYVGRDHRLDDKTLDGNRNEICRYCKQKWIDKG